MTRGGHVRRYRDVGGLRIVADGAGVGLARGAVGQLVAVSGERIDDQIELQIARFRAAVDGDRDLEARGAGGNGDQRVALVLHGRHDVVLAGHGVADRIEMVMDLDGAMLGVVVESGQMERKVHRRGLAGRGLGDGRRGIVPDDGRIDDVDLRGGCQGTAEAVAHRIAERIRAPTGRDILDPLLPAGH